MVDGDLGLYQLIDGWFSVVTHSWNSQPSSKNEKVKSDAALRMKSEPAASRTSPSYGMVRLKDVTIGEAGQAAEGLKSAHMEPLLGACVVKSDALSSNV